MCAVNSKRRSPCNFFYLILLFVLKYFLKGKVKKTCIFRLKMFALLLYLDII